MKKMTYREYTLEAINYQEPDKVAVDIDGETYRLLFRFPHKILCDYIKTHNKMHIFIHSCVSIYLLIPNMIEAGIEILDPVQIRTHNMAAEFLKKEC